MWNAGISDGEDAEKPHEPVDAVFPGILIHDENGRRAQSGGEFELVVESRVLRRPVAIRERRRLTPKHQYDLAFNLDVQDELLKLGLAENIDVYFRSKKSSVKGLVCKLAGLLILDRHRSTIAAALEDLRPVRLYHEGCFFESTVAGLAEAALKSF